MPNDPSKTARVQGNRGKRVKGEEAPTNLTSAKDADINTARLLRSRRYARSKNTCRAIR